MALFNRSNKKERGVDTAPDLRSPELTPKPGAEGILGVEKGPAIPELEKSKGYAEAISGEKDKPGLKSAPAATTDTSTTAIPLPKSERLQKIERILSVDLEDVYLSMDEVHRQLFKVEGERAARQIESLISSGKAVVRKIVSIIKTWLKIIPGISKFFIAQEAKIKADKIIEAEHYEGKK